MGDHLSKINARLIHSLMILSVVGGLFLTTGQATPVSAATSGEAYVPYVADNFHDNAGGNTGLTGNDGMVDWRSRLG